MAEKKADRVDKALLTPDQLCDALEVYLGREEGNKACRELLTRLEDDPSWRAQLNTMSCTVQVFQRCKGVEVPDDVSYRLMHTLNLKGTDDGTCDDEAKK
jgi:hypothetical protein